MCANFHVEITDSKMMEIMKAAAKNGLEDDFSLLLEKKGEVFPSYVIPVMSAPETFRPMTWGFALEGKSQPVFNAREETALERPMFSEAMLRRRCLIPATKYYEWKKEGKKKMKYYFQLPGQGIMYLAGCWRMERSARLPSCVILTRDAAGDLGSIHPRMPVIIPPERVDEWLTESTAPMKQPTLWLDFGPVFPDEPEQMSLFDQED